MAKNWRLFGWLGIFFCATVYAANPGPAPSPPANWEANFGVDLLLADDDLISIPLPSGFTFPYAGSIFSLANGDTLEISANGFASLILGGTGSNGDGCNPSCEGDPAQLLAPGTFPRFAPLWQDLNPSPNSGSDPLGGVFLNTNPAVGSSLVVTWATQFRTPNTPVWVQLQLFGTGSTTVPPGTFRFLYGNPFSVRTHPLWNPILVGFGPGDLLGAPPLPSPVDLSLSSFGDALPPGPPPVPPLFPPAPLQLPFPDMAFELFNPLGIPADNLFDLPEQTELLFTPINPAAFGAGFSLLGTMPEIDLANFLTAAVVSGSFSFNPTISDPTEAPFGTFFFDAQFCNTSTGVAISLPRLVGGPQGALVEVISLTSTEDWLRSRNKDGNPISDPAGRTGGVSARQLFGTILAPAGCTIVPFSIGVGSGAPINFLLDGRGHTLFAVAAVADPQFLTTPQNTPLAITLTGSHISDLPLTFSILTAPSGSLGPIIPLTPVSAPSSATVLYTPQPGFNGPDSFVFQVDAGGGDIAQATVDIIVGTANSPPIADGQDLATNEDINLPITLTATDADGDNLTFTLISGPSDGVLTGLPAAGVTGPPYNVAVTYDPNPDFNGSDSFVFQVDDGATTSQATVDVIVNPINDPPTVSAGPGPFTVIGNVSINVPQAAGLLDGATITDPDGAGTPPLPFSVNTPLPTTSVNGGNVSINATNGSFTYDPPAGFTGADSFQYAICDNGIPLPSTCSGAITVNLTVGASRIWFIDNSVGGTNQGTQANPFTSLGEFENVNGNGGINPATGDCVYMEQTGTDYTEPVTLENNQTFVGEGSTAGIASVCNITLVPNSTLPVTGGTKPIITSAGNGINLAADNTIRGLTIGNTSGIGISGTSVGTLTISETSINGTGEGINITTGGMVVAFDEISSSNTRGIRLNGISGNFNVTTGTINAGAGTAVDIDGNIMVSLGITLASVSSQTGSVVGITLTDTNGSFTVNGGTIRNKTGADGSTTQGIGIFMNNVQGISLSGMQLNDFSNFAIRGTNVTNFSMVGNTVNGVNGNSTAANEGSISFNNLLGTATFTNNTISGGFQDNIVVTNTTGTLTAMNVTGGTIGLNSNANGNDGIQIETQSNATANLRVSGVNFLGARGDNVQCNAIQSSTMACDVLDSDFSNAHPNIVSAGGGNTLSGGGAGSTFLQTYDVSGTTPGSQNYSGADGSSITINYVSGLGTGRGFVANNAVGISGNSGSGSLSGAGIAVGASNAVQHITNINNNVIFGIDGAAGIDALANDNSSFHGTIANNTVAQMGGFAFAAMNATLTGAGTGTATACLDFDNNVFDASGGPFAGNAVAMAHFSPMGNYILPGYTGSPNGEFAFNCAAGTASANVHTHKIGNGHTLMNGPFALFPAIGVDANSVCGVVGAGVCLTP